MTPLLAQIITKIQREGPITFAAFMDAALYDPKHGYYGSGRARIGAGGDFQTAVSVGPLFGALLARQFVEMWDRLGRPAEWSLLEQGAFDGQLAEDVLNGLQHFAPACFEATTLRLVEPLAPLRELQMEKLSRFGNRVVWHSGLDTLPVFVGVHYSNELMDAFPVHRLRLDDRGWQEWRVRTDGTTLGWVEAEIEDVRVRAAADRLHQIESGSFGEVCAEYDKHLQSVGSKLKDGWLLALDYGMSAAELAIPIRRDGTLTAYRQQRRVENLLADPGEQDLTAHVNFSALAIQAKQTGWTLEGYAEQHRFFTGLAPLHFRDSASPLSREEQRTLLAFRTLTHPQLMGFQFKAFCLRRQAPSPEAELPPLQPRVGLSGFSLAPDPEKHLFTATQV